MIRTSVNLGCIYTELPFEKRFAAAKADGFDYIEFWDFADKDLKQVKQLLDENGLKMSTMSGDGPYSMCDPALKDKYIDRIKDAIDAAKVIECPTLVIHSDTLEEWPQYAVPLSGEYSDLEKYLTMYDTLSKIAPMAEKAGVTFVLEALNIEKDHKRNFLAYTEDSVALVKTLGSPNVKILYDAYHMYLDEGKVCESIEKYSDYMGYIHIADAPGRNEPGTGTINYKKVLEVLSKTEYDAFVGFEFYPQTDTATAIKAVKDVCSVL